MSVNPSEERLADLSRQTFLSMWSYQNPYYEQGKELCDVLIVFGDDVIIISDKVIRYAEDKASDVAWDRWYRKAVLASVRQLQGAMKTIINAPDSIHLDAKISSPFPLRFPHPDQSRYHLIAVAHGSEEACMRSTGSPSLAVDSRLDTDRPTPFAVGVHFQDFVHVFNRTALDSLFESFDTATDLVRYLSVKKSLLEARRVTFAGEEDLIALYMAGRRPDGTAPLEELVARVSSEAGEIPSGIWEAVRSNPAYARRKEALADSYVVDDVIEQLADEYLAGRMLQSQDQELAYHANAFHLLASESRMGRMLIAQGVVDVLTEDPRTYWSVVVESADQRDVIYVWLVYPKVGPEVSDEELEADVDQALAAYVLVAMSKFPAAQIGFGIAMPNRADTRTSRSFKMFGREGWDTQRQAEIEALGRANNILSDLETSHYVATRAI